MIFKEALEEYKRIYKKNFGKHISDKEAIKQANKLLNLIKVIHRPMLKNSIK